MECRVTTLITRTSMNHDKKADILMLVGRILLSIIFIVAGVSKIGGFAAAAAYTGTVLPFPELLTALVIVLEIVGGVMLLVGYKIKIAAWTLASFTLLTAFLYHFNLADQVQSGFFMKNLAMAGGLLYVAALGAGAYGLGGGKKPAAPSSAS